MTIPGCEAAVDAFLNSVSLEKVQQLADEVIKESFEDLVHGVGADAGAIWIVDPDQSSEITIAVNVGARGSEIEGEVSQNLDSGLVSKAYKQEELISDEGVIPHAEKSLDVDQQLAQMTLHQIAAPFKMFGKTIGAVTVVQFVTATGAQKKEWGLREDATESFQRWVAVAERLFEYKCLESGS